MKFLTSVFSSLHNGLQYVRTHPQLLLTLVLVLVIPIAFLISGQQFLNASRENQERLEMDRIGLLHDAFVSMIGISNADPAVLQKEIEAIATENPDIRAFRVVEKTEDGFVPIAALDTDVLGDPEPDSAPYTLAFTNPDESLVQNMLISDERFLRGFRLAEHDDTDFVILTLTSREEVDALFASRIQTAYIWLFVLLAIVLALVLRHVRLIDYAYLYQETKRANEMKDLFTNMIAHELRAPLTAMRGYASMIRENDSIDRSVREQATRIERSAERLVVIVSDLLDVARIQSGKLAIERTGVNLSEVVTAVGEELLPSAKEKGIDLEYVDVPDDVRIVSDPKRLHQALTNLISNSIKYTSKGSIALEVDERRDRIELRVKDTGRGISADDQKKLFAPFFRVENKDVSKITGTGLGMWITKQLIELMDGSIGVESIKGVGTHIVVTLPKNS